MHDMPPLGMIVDFSGGWVEGLHLSFMASSASPAFELRGEFRGFFRDIFGKRRMVLRVEGEERYLKVPKELRELLAGKIAPGDEIVAGGVEEDRKPVVSRVRLAAGAEICAACPIKVCTKKTCWRNGGRELWQALEHQLARAGLDGVVELKGVDCLDRCKHGPNADWQRHEFERCRPADAETIVAKVAEELGVNSR